MQEKSKTQGIIGKCGMIKESLLMGLTSKLEETSNETHRAGCSKLWEQHM